MKKIYLISAILLVLLALGACAAPTPEVIVETVEVEKEVTVVETVEVEVEKEVTVVETVEVEVDITTYGEAPQLAEMVAAG